MTEPNLHAPNLYADKLDFVATLINLPGASNNASHWELSYQLFFIPEEKFNEALRGFPKGGLNPTPEQFPGRILLADAQRKRLRVGTMKERTIQLKSVPFKQKVPDALRTKFAYLMTAYSLKIFDAELKTTIYKSGIFLAAPFELPDDQEQAIARRTIYLSFLMNPNGTLNYSQLPPEN